MGGVTTCATERWKVVMASSYWRRGWRSSQRTAASLKYRQRQPVTVRFVRSDWASAQPWDRSAEAECATPGHSAWFQFLLSGLIRRTFRYIQVAISKLSERYI